MRAVSALLLAALLTAAAGSRAEVALDVHGLLSRHALTPVSVLPAATLRIGTPGADQVTLFSPEVAIEASGAHHWQLTAPATPGVYPVHASGPDGGVTSLQLFVTRPFNNESRLGDYRIGAYPSPATAPRKGHYPIPQGLIEVGRHQRDVQVSRHFTVGQFLCKQAAGWPRYLALQRPLLVMLENIVELMQREGIPATTLTVLSGYRTPWYNRSIGNVAYSRHLYGDAADVYVDSDGDGFMDDLNGDGVVSLADAKLLAQLIATLPEAATSGIGVYAANAYHGPFVHVDTRGYTARW